MHQYTAYTCLTLSDNPVLITLWKEAVPKHAFRYQFLLQGILAIAAQHKLHDQPESSPRLVDTANYYYQESLQTYINLLNNITKENCHALFAFSQLIVGILYCRLSMSFYGKPRRGQEFITDLIDAFELLKGAGTIGLQARPWLADGNLKSMLGNRPRPPSDFAKAHGPGIEALSKLSVRISTQIGDEDAEGKDRSSLSSTIQLLYTLFLEDPGSVDRFNKILGLPVWLDANYLSLLRAQDHAALTVLSYYGVALHQVRHAWILHGLGAKIVEIVNRLVSEDWSTHLEWPSKEVHPQKISSVLASAVDEPAS